MRIVSSLVEAVGLAAFVAGFVLFDWRAGLIAFGLVLVLVGFALDRGDGR